MDCTKKSKTIQYKRVEVDGVYTTEHRAVLEKYLKRKLTRKEVVHHINGNPRDNRLENLIVLTQLEHNRLHKEKYPKLKKCPNCGKLFHPPVNHRSRNKFCCLKCAMQFNARKREKPIIATDKKTLKETEFDSLKSASFSINGQKTNICKALKGKIKTAYGYYWRYK